MTNVIDTNSDTSRVLGQLKNAGVQTVIRYITTSTNSEKCVKPEEARAIAAAGLKLGLVFEIWGGSKDFSRGDINADSGRQHGMFARNWASKVGAPDGAIVWFAIDNDVNEGQFSRFVRPYFTEVREALAGEYRTGIYGCGFACQRCLDLGLADAAWLSNAMGWNGSKTFRTSNRWHLLQGAETNLLGMSVDPNQPRGEDYGAFVPFGTVPPSTGLASAPGPHPDGQAMLNHIVETARVELTKAKTMTDSSRPPPQQTSLPVPSDVAALKQTLGWIADVNAVTARAQALVGGAGASRMLSPIDKALGGQAMVGFKTPLAIVAYAGLSIMQAFGAVGPATGADATATGQVLTALIAAFGGLGVVSKFGRVVQALGILARLARTLVALAPAL